MRGPRLHLGILLALVIGLLTPLAAAAQQADVTCDDFATQEGAQYVLDTTRDDDVADELDPDGDGIACDDLPSRDSGDDRGNTDEANGEATEEATEETDGGELPQPRGNGGDEDATGRDATDATDQTDEADADDRTPLNGRFGSPRDLWEAEYGEPVSDDAGEYPLGFDYDVRGFGNVNAYFHKDYVAYITLEAERGDPWSERQAEQAVEDFLPTDVEVDEAFETDDGDLLTPAHSLALEGRFGDSTYEGYGASGVRGDLYYLFLLDRNGDIDVIEVGLGNDVQQPAGEETDATEGTDGTEETATGDGEYSAEDIAYLEDLRVQFDVVAASMDEFERILDGLNAGTIEAADAGAQLRTVFDTWRQAKIDAESLNPPASSEQTHEIYGELVDLLSQAADDYTNGLLNADDALLEAGDQKYGQATILRPLIEALLTNAGV